MRTCTGKLLVLNIPRKPRSRAARSAVDTAAYLPVLSAMTGSALLNLCLRELISRSNPWAVSCGHLCLISLVAPLRRALPQPKTGVGMWQRLPASRPRKGKASRALRSHGVLKPRYVCLTAVSCRHRPLSHNNEQLGMTPIAMSGCISTM